MAHERRRSFSGQGLQGGNHPPNLPDHVGGASLVQGSGGMTSTTRLSDLPFASNQLFCPWPVTIWNYVLQGMSAKDLPFIEQGY
jgi:hypothetical protein